jgi:hypothetical protein
MAYRDAFADGDRCAILLFLSAVLLQAQVHLLRHLA